jgi:UDPglucose 6-dehydrogenase
MRISIVGAGYVGLVTGACFAEKGHKVVCVDVDESKVEIINKRKSPIYEIGLEQLLQKNVGTNLFSTSDLHSSVINSEITLIAVGTPFNGRGIDLTFIKDATLKIGEALRHKQSLHSIVVKSTVIPGTTDDFVTPLLEKVSGKKADVDFDVGVNPEFLTEGQAVQDFLFPDRIVLGSNNARCFETLNELYSNFKNVPMVRVNNKTAEMIKYASNAMLATSISFANELGNLCSVLGGVDIVDVMKGVHLSNYLRPRCFAGERVQAPITSFFEAGCGFGGSCLPKDVKAIIACGKEVGVEMPILSSVIKTNEQQPRRMIEILKHFFPSLKDVKVAVLGLSFKPDTSDIRESPAIPIIHYLLEGGAVIVAYDPAAISEARKIFNNLNVKFACSLPEAINEAQAIVVITKWKEFEKLPELLKETKPPPVVVDGRRMLDKSLITNYSGIGLQANPKTSINSA